MSKRNYITSIFFRLSLCSLAVIWFVISQVEPRSMAAQFAVANGNSFMEELTCLLGIAGLIDVFINDILPERFCWRGARRHRHLILVGLAFGYMAQLYTAMFTFKSLGLNLFYVWNAVSLLSLALIDAHYRSKSCKDVHAQPRFFV